LSSLRSSTAALRRRPGAGRTSKAEVIRELLSQACKEGEKR